MENEIWFNVIKWEINSIKKNGTWEYVDLLKGKKQISTE
jgi:hypothetical protein